MVELRVQGKLYRFTRPGLKKWLELDEIIQALGEAAEAKDNTLLVDKFLEIASVAFSIEKTSLDDLKWYEIKKIYIDIIEEIKINDVFPILQIGEQINDQGWSYKGRPWYFWLHTLSKAYGWDTKYIENLDINDAIGLYQEISFEDYKHSEFLYGLSEVAYGYNESTKKSEYRPFPKLPWLFKDIPLEPKKIKILKSSLPVGNVIGYNKREE